MSNSKCLMTFKKLKIDEKDTFAVGVRDGIFNNPTIFNSPPLTLPLFDGLITMFINKRGAYKAGGNLQRGDYEMANMALIDGLVSMARYVDTVAMGNAAIIWTSGFRPSKGSSSQQPAPGQMIGVTVKRGSTGVLMGECANDSVVDFYGCIITEGAPLPEGFKIDAAGQIWLRPNDSAGINPETGEAITVRGLFASQAQVKGAAFSLTKGRKKKFIGLTAGMTYYFYFYGVNAQGVGALSEPKSIICW